MRLKGKISKLPYSWKFSRDINFKVFEDFDVSLKVKPLKFGFKIIIIGESRNFIREKLERGNHRKFCPSKFPAIQYAQECVVLTKYLASHIFTHGTI